MQYKSQPRSNFETREEELELRELLNTPDGFDRYAKEKMPEFIQVIRDYEGFVRDVIMTPSVDPEDLVRIDEEVFVTYAKDIDGMAGYIARNGEAQTLNVKARTIKVAFFPMTTPRITITQWDLDTQPYDLVKRTQEKCGEAMAKLEDIRFLKVADMLLAANPGQVTSQPEAAISKAGLLAVKKIFSRNNVPFSTYLMNPATYDDFLLWGEDDLDDYTQRSVLETGELPTIWNGVKMVSGIIVPEDKVYGLSPKEIVGRMPILRDLTIDNQRNPETYDREVMAFQHIGLFIHSHLVVARLDLNKTA